MTALQKSTKNADLGGGKTKFQKHKLEPGLATLLIELAHEKNSPVHIHRGQRFIDDDHNNWVIVLLEFFNKDEREVNFLMHEAESIYFRLI